MTDNEIIKALECCSNSNCVNCPRWTNEWSFGMCNDFLPSVLDLINRQKAEIEMLKNDRDFWESVAKTEVSEAIIEFAERVIKDSRNYFVSKRFKRHIPDIAKEMIMKNLEVNRND